MCNILTRWNGTALNQACAQFLRAELNSRKSNALKCAARENDTQVGSGVEIFSWMDIKWTAAVLLMNNLSTAYCSLFHLIKLSRGLTQRPPPSRHSGVVSRFSLTRVSVPLYEYSLPSLESPAADVTKEFKAPVAEMALALSYLTSALGEGICTGSRPLRHQLSTLDIALEGKALARASSESLQSRQYRPARPCRRSGSGSPGAVMQENVIGKRMESILNR